MTGEAAPLAYADELSRWGIVVEHDPAFCRIVIPPLPSIRFLHRGFFIGGTILLLLFVFFVHASFLTPGGNWRMHVVNLLLYGIAVAIVVAAAWHRLRRRLVLHIDADNVILLDITGRRVRKFRWWRGEVGEIKRNRSNNKLLIRVTDRELFEVFATPNTDVTDSIASIANEALRTKFQPSEEKPRIELPQTVSPLARRLAIATSIAMVALSIVLFFLGFPWTPIAFYTLLFSVAPLGMVFGSQPREFYF